MVGAKFAPSVIEKALISRNCFFDPARRLAVLPLRRFPLYARFRLPGRLWQFSGQRWDPDMLAESDVSLDVNYAGRGTF